MGEQDPGDGPVDGGGVVIGRRQAGQRRRSAADPPVAGLRVVLEDHSARRTARVPPGVPIGQEIAVCRPRQPNGRSVLVRNRPADVVVAAGVCDPGGGRRLRRQRAECPGGQGHVAGGQRRPHLHHETVVVSDVADLAVMGALAQVLHQLVGRDDGFRFENNRRTGDPHHSAEGLGDRMHFGLVLAVGAESLPDEGDGVEPQHLHTEISQEQDDLGVFGEYFRVRPVDVPLVGVEGGPHPALCLIVPGEAAWGEVGEDLRQEGFVGVGFRAIRIDPEVVAVLGVSGARGPRPGVLAGDVVQHQVDDQADAGTPEPAGEQAKIVDGTETRVHRAVVGHRVAAVVVPFASPQQRHQMEIVHAQFGQIAQVIADLGEAAGEPVGVGGVPDHRGLLEPVRSQQPPLVQLVEVLLAIAKGRGRSGNKGVRKSSGGVAVEQRQRIDQIGPPAVQAQREGAPAQRVHSVEHPSRGFVDLRRRAGHEDIVRYPRRIRRVGPGPVDPQ